MFDVAPSELLILAIVALVVIGPKDLPKALRFVGNWVGKARGMARHFRSGIDTMMREAEIEEMEANWRAKNEAIMRAHPAATVDAAQPDQAQPLAAVTADMHAADSAPAIAAPATAPPTIAGPVVTPASPVGPMDPDHGR